MYKITNSTLFKVEWIQSTNQSTPSIYSSADCWFVYSHLCWLFTRTFVDCLLAPLLIVYSHLCWLSTRTFVDCLLAPLQGCGDSGGLCCHGQHLFVGVEGLWVTIWLPTSLHLPCNYATALDQGHSTRFVSTCVSVYPAICLPVYMVYISTLYSLSHMSVLYVVRHIPTVCLSHFSPYIDHCV